MVSRGHRRQLATLVLVWVFSYAVYGLYFQGQWVFGERPIFSITGDEPHYLTIATSLVSDGDLEVLDEYRDKEYFPYYPFHLGDARDPEDMHALYGRGGALYSKHGVGLPLLLAPTIRLGGYGWATLLMLGIAALLSTTIFLLARETTESLWAALLAWVAIAFSPPLLLYAPLFYPEMPGALLALWGVRGALAYRRRGSWRGLLATGVAFGALPWLHLRYVPISVLLGFAGLAMLLRRRELATWLSAALLAPPVVGGAALWLLNWRLFGGIPPVDEYGAVALGRFVDGAPGLLFDRQFGLLPYAPAFLVVPLGLGSLRRVLGWSGSLALLGPIAAYAAFVACVSYWYGAFSPPARMLVPVLPLCVVPVALALERRPWLRMVLVGLLVATAAIAHLLMDVPRLRYNLPDGTSGALEDLSRAWGTDITSWLPTFVKPSPASYVWAVSACTVLGVVYFAATRSTPRAAPRVAPAAAA
ncbi:MAG TPA: hypothetical protein VFG86_16375 [Chloroflexota bacterium]|nr:hypothetical protein [Chloroflexota bacterium]